ENRPKLQRVGVSTLQLDDSLAGPGCEIAIPIKFCPGGLIELAEVTDRQRRCSALLAGIYHVLDQHAERCSPVANVVFPYHGSAGALQKPNNSVANYGRTKVPDMHLFGHI